MYQVKTQILLDAINNESPNSCSELLEIFKKVNFSILSLTDSGHNIIHVLCLCSSDKIDYSSLIKSVNEDLEVDLNLCDKHGATPMLTVLRNYYLAESSRLEICKGLLNLKADPSIADESGLSPLILLQIHDSQSPWATPLLTQIQNRIEVLDERMNNSIACRSKNILSGDLGVDNSNNLELDTSQSNLFNSIDERDAMALQRNIKSYYSRDDLYKKSTVFTDIVFDSDWGNLFFPDDFKVLEILVAEKFKINDVKLFQYLVQQQSFIQDVLKMLKKLNYNSSTIRSWLLITPEIDNTHKLKIVSELVENSKNDDITEEVSSLLEFAEVDDIPLIVDLIFDSSVGVDWEQVMKNHVILNSEEYDLNIEELLNKNNAVIYTDTTAADSLSRSVVKEMLTQIAPRQSH